MPSPIPSPVSPLGISCSFGTGTPMPLRGPFCDRNTRPGLAVRSRISVPPGSNRTAIQRRAWRFVQPTAGPRCRAPVARACASSLTVGNFGDQDWTCAMVSAIGLVTPRTTSVPYTTEKTSLRAHAWRRQSPPYRQRAARGLRTNRIPIVPSTDQPLRSPSRRPKKSPSRSRQRQLIPRHRVFVRAAPLDLAERE